MRLAIGVYCVPLPRGRTQGEKSMGGQGWKNVKRNYWICTPIFNIFLVLRAEGWGGGGGAELKKSPPRISIYWYLRESFFILMR